MPKVKSNRKIDAALINGEWEIHIPTAMIYLQSYLHDLELLDSGMKLKELNYSKQRAESRPAIIFEQKTVKRGSKIFGSDVQPGSIAHFRINGAMRVQDGFSSRGMASMAKLISEANNNENIAGMLFEIDSGGGQALAGTLIQNAIREVDKPTVAFGNMIASAAYRAISGVDKILTSGSDARVGSLGTMASIDKGMAKWLKKNVDDIYADASTLKNADWRAYIEGDKSIIVNKLNMTNDLFLEEIEELRDLTVDQELRNRVLSGELFHSTEAQKAGLIDGIATFNGALTELQGIIEARSPMANNRFFNQTQSGMKFNEFLKKGIGLINGLLGLEIKEDATAENVIEALEAATPLAKLKEEMTAQIKDELKAELETGSDEANQKLQDQLKELKASQEANEKKIKELEESKTSLETELATLKGEADDKGEGKTQTGSPKVSQFATAGNFMKSLQPNNESKY